MNFKEITFLINQNWRLFSKTKFSIGKKERFSVPRVYLILPAISYLGYKAYFGNSLLSLAILFLMSLFFIEMARIANRCFFDPIHLVYSPSNFRNKLFHIILSEWFGVKFLSFILFSVIAGIGPYGLQAVSILTCLYGIATILFVFISIIGNRLRIISVVYQWILIMLFAILFGFSGLSFSDAEVALDMHLSLQDWILFNFTDVLLFLLGMLVACYFACYRFTKLVYRNQPFINPDSFPRKII